MLSMFGSGYFHDSVVENLPDRNLETLDIALLVYIHDCKIFIVLTPVF